jgi:uncharacterized protein (DUF302 family)
MNYYFNKTLTVSYDEAYKLISEKLKQFGFGIVSEIDMHEKFKEKLDVDFRRYKILGACNPKHAHTAVNVEEHIGLMLPCNVVLQERNENEVEVSAIDPVASMQAIENPALAETAGTIREKLQQFIEAL